MYWFIHIQWLHYTLHDLAMTKIFSVYSKTSILALGPTQLLFNRYQGPQSSQGTGHRAQHSPSSSANIKTECSHTTTSPVYLCDVYRVNVLFSYHLVTRTKVQTISDSRGPGYHGWYSNSLRAGRSGDWILVGARFFAPIHTGPESHPASCPMGTGSFPGVKQLGHSIDHPPKSSAAAKESVDLYLYSHSGPSWPVLGWTVPLPLPLFLTAKFILVKSSCSNSSTIHHLICNWLLHIPPQSFASLPWLSYWCGDWNFGARFMKHILFEQKKIQTEMNVTLWK